MIFMKIIFIAFSENTLGRRILNGLIEKGNIPNMVFMASNKAFRKFRKNGVKRYVKRNGVLNLIWRVIYRLTLRKDLKDHSLKGDINLRTSIVESCILENIPIRFFDDINSDEFILFLEGLNPDLIVLGGAPLLKEKILNLPRIGIINSHPGILPQAKGMDVVAHSIINKIPLGVTVFKVDTGIDSGPILLKRDLKLSTKGKKLHEIESLVEELAADLMIVAVETIKSGDYRFVEQLPEGKIFNSLKYSTYKKVVKTISDGDNS